MTGDGNESEAETLQQRLRSNLTQLYAERAILERVVYKNKNQHRRSSYFQYLLKVRRDLKLLQTARLEDLMNSCFQVLIGDKPNQRIHHLESLKKGAHDGGKPNFMESLLGAARLLAEMVEPMLKAACEISILLARSFFMAFSLVVVALLARLRVLVQQILLDLVSAFNMVSSISQEKQSAKLTREGIEVVREYYPLRRDYPTLECVWGTDKYALLEKTQRIENTWTKESGLDSPHVAMEVQYHSIECLLEDEHAPAMESPEVPESDVKSICPTEEIHSGSQASITSHDTLTKQDEVVHEAGNDAVETESSPGHESLQGGTPTCSPATVDIPKAKNVTGKVAFVSVKRPWASACGNPEAKRSRYPAGGDEGTSFDMLSGGNIQESLS